MVYFNHYVTFPFLHCVERSSQSELLTILPQFYNDLLAAKTETLADFVVSMHGMLPPQLTSELAVKITGMDVLIGSCSGEASMWSGIWIR